MVGTRRKLRDILEPVRVREIGEATLRVVARKGLEGATMQEIADEAGLAKGTLYLYFESRDDLIIHVAEAAFEELLAAVAKAIGQKGSAEDRLEAGIRTHVEFFEERRDLFRLFISAAHPGSMQPHSARQTRACSPLYNSYLDLLAAFFSEAQASGEIRPIRADRLALFVAEGVAGVILKRLAEPSPPPVEDDVRLIAGALSSGIFDRRTS
jgi:TetR/AcrR family fatty acid metabolism transcriptional regulator